jgi:polyphosphate kinase
MPRDEPRFCNRELNWLAFNQRVLEEAANPGVPLLERLFFLGVVGTNLDEFFMVRVGGLHLQTAAGLTRTDPAGLEPAETLRQVRARARQQAEEQQACLRQKILPGLAARQVSLAPGAPLDPEATRLLDPAFEEQVFPLLTPVAVGPGTAPLLAPLAAYLAVRLAPAPGADAPRHALIRLGPGVPRVWPVPGSGAAGRRFVLLEDLVRAFLPRLLPGQEIREAAAFRVTRNADMAVDEEFAPDLADAMARVLRERRTGPCVRLEVESAASPELAAFLRDLAGAAPEDVVCLPGPLCIAGLGELRAHVSSPALVYPAWTPQPHPALDPGRSLFEQVARQDAILATPYESFDPLVRLVESAAADPDVLAIKIVLYRTGTRGPLVRALAAAAQAGKPVTALIELKARFDEARNMDWARSLEEAGVQVVYGVRNLKTHAKVCLVIRRTDEGVRTCVHLGTGNYNAATSRTYTDVGLLTADPVLGRDATVFFHAVTGFSEPQSYGALVQAPNGLRERLLDLIRFETRQAADRLPAAIDAKLNALTDPEIIAALYEASRAGVEIRLCVRGACCLRPGVRGLSDNIAVTSIIDRFLEHSRILRFRHGGAEEIFLSSADWMPRNLDRRIELLVPVRDAACRRRLAELLDAALADNVKAWRMLPDGTYERVLRPHGQRPIRSQEELCERARAAAKQARRAARTVFEPHLPRKKGK